MAGLSEDPTPLKKHYERWDAWKNNFGAKVPKPSSTHTGYAEQSKQANSAVSVAAAATTGELTERAAEIEDVFQFSLSSFIKYATSELDWGSVRAAGTGRMPRSSAHRRALRRPPTPSFDGASRFSIYCGSPCAWKSFY